MTKNQNKLYFSVDIKINLIYGGSMERNKAVSKKKKWKE